MSSFEKRVQINKVIESQLPEFLVSDFPKAVEFFRQYYISQEFQGGNADLVGNLDQYLKLDNLVPEVITGKTTLSDDISSTQDVISVYSTKGFPSEYGLLKIDDEIITYTGITTNTFTGCVRGFSGVTGYNYLSKFDLDKNASDQSLVFEQTKSSSHSEGSTVNNLSVLFLQEFYKKLKYTFTPGLESFDFVSDLDVGNFIKHARDFYQSKGTDESIKILFKVLYGVSAEVIDLESRLIKPSAADYIRREIVTAKLISGNPINLEGQTIFKSNDPNTNASVSNVEIFTRDDETFYKLELFVGYNDKDLINGNFTVPAKTRIIENISIGSSIISVDSTIGFPQEGILNLISSGNSISYKSKSINQFFECSGINSNIAVGSDIRSDETIYGYENGDISKRVDLRITGVISDFFVSGDDTYSTNKGDEIIIRNLGELIENPQNGEKTYKQIFANSWIYNTSTRYKIKSISGSTFTLYSDIDKSSLRIGDKVDILFDSSNNVALSNATISSINIPLKQIILDELTGFVPNPSLQYDIRRKVKKSTSSNVNISLGNNSYISDILNVYTDNSYGYIASNSLPSYTINDELIESSIPNGSETYLKGKDENRRAYSSISFSSDVKFIDGDLVVYNSLNPLKGLSSGLKYYVKLISSNQIRLYESKSLIDVENLFDRDGNAIPPYIFFGDIDSINTGSHRFTLEKYESRVITANKILRKFPLKSPDYNTKKEVLRYPKTLSSGGIGVLIDGVEITNPESVDRIYYGPIKEFNVLNGGTDYDIINPPRIIISAGSGTTALVDPIINGSVKNVFVDPQNFDIENVRSLTLTGGNGSGCVLEPIVGNRFREVEFDARTTNIGGGVDITYETISFLTPHNFKDGETVIYSPNGNSPLLTGVFGDVTNTPTGELLNGSQYVVKSVNSQTIKLFYTRGDYLAGINTVGFSTTTTFGGIHKFRTLPKKTLSSIRVLNSGSGYQYRKLRVNPSGISTEYNYITYKNHGFSSGDIVNYSTTGVSVVGLSTQNSYSVDLIDSDKFKLIDVGIGATFRDNLQKNKNVIFKSTGSGTHIFEYPPITINADVSFASTSFGSFNFTPIVTGNISEVYLYESGSGYGSTIFTLNLHKKPKITVKNGKNAKLKPIISNGRILAVEVSNIGQEYYSTPKISITGSGTGAVLRPVISNGSIVDVIVLNSGIGYDPQDTTIQVVPRGSGAIFDIVVRDLTVNDAERYSKYTKTRDVKIFSSLIESKEQNSLVYGIYGYSEDLASNYSDFGNFHSPIIGWAYDGNPIYGPYGYSKIDNIQSQTKILKSGYNLNTFSVIDRPSLSIFPPGFFIEDYEYTGSGDLDIHNGRFCKTPEFPNGVYAYFATVSNSLTSNKLEPTYPYFIGNTFKSPFIEENLYLNQDFDFENSDLIRNTYPYKINDEYADYDFIVEPYERYPQISEIQSATRGYIEDIKVIDGGKDYKVKDIVNFDRNETLGGIGLRAEVSEIFGKDITKIETNLEPYYSCVLEWENNKSVSAYYQSGFELMNNDTVVISGISTSINNIFGSKKIGFSTESVGLAKTINSYSSPGGKVEDILVSSVPKVSIGGSISIVSSSGKEIVKVLNNYENGILRIKRFGSTGVAHSFGSQLNILNDTIKIPVQTKQFSSERNKIVYFNAKNSVGIGTTLGISISKTFSIGGISQNVSIPTRSIYLPNHPFKTGQKITFEKFQYSGIDSLIVGDNPNNLNTYLIPDVLSSLYVINKGKDYIGIVTQVGLTTNTEGLFFYSDGSDNSEYLFKTNFNQITAEINRVVTTVSVGQSHGLSQFDTIRLNVVPNIVVGLGTTGPLSVKYSEKGKKLLINNIGINSTQINTATNTITISNHGYKTGDKLFYDSAEVASGLSTGSYYVIKIDSNTFKLAETLYETRSESENSVNIVGTGASIHNFGLINPQINVVKNSILKFDISDSSLRGYEFKIYTDQNFKNEFVSVGNQNYFNVVGVGTIGFGTASLSINYSEGLPSKLFYALEKSRYISTSDNYFTNHSEINYIESEYNGTYSVFGISTNSFKISPIKVPTILSYSKDQVEKLEYSTSSSTASNGPISRVKIISKGFGYDKIPAFIDVTSESGSNANLSAISKNIGKIKNIKFKTIAYEYPSDKTLRPEGYLSSNINLKNSDTIQEIQVVFGGSKYLNPPNLVLFNETTKKVVDNILLEPTLRSGSISEVIQIAPIQGLRSEPHKIIATNNSNGVAISSITTNNSGIVTCVLSTPIFGFSSPPFKSGDEIFVEGIELIDNSNGTGYNSEDYDYRFFKVDSYTNSNPAVLRFSIVDELGVRLSTNPGIAKTSQSSYTSIVNKNDYPIFNVIKKTSEFLLGEQLLVDSGTGFVEEDLKVEQVISNSIKVSGRYKLKLGDKIKGKTSGVLADVDLVTGNKVIFEIGYSTKQNIGWSNDIGKISEDYQVIPDNDYYQNLSYSIKSPISWEEFSSPVNSIIHPAGLKNFADVGILSTSSVTGVSVTTNTLVILDVLEEKKVDTINNFDTAVDYDPKTNPQISKYIKFKNKKLTSYTECITNRVVIHDDISSKFSSRGYEDIFVEIEEINQIDTHIRYTIQVVDIDTLDSQITELVLHTTALDSILFEKYTEYTNELLGYFSANVDDFGRKTLIFTPTNRFTRDHDIKILRKTFEFGSSGIGTQSFGSIKLIGSSIGISSVGTANSVRTIAQFDSNNFNALFANVEITNNTTKDVNYIDGIIEFDGTNTYISEYYFDNYLQSYSSSSIGLVTSTYDSISGIVSFRVKNEELNDIVVRSNIVGFANTASGIGTYRFLVSGQPEGSERSVRLESTVGVGTTSVRVGTFDYDTISACNSIVRVSCGSSSAVHQVSLVKSPQKIIVTSGAYSFVNNVSGLGTFGSEIDGDKFYLNFYPDISNTNTSVQGFNEVFYTYNDIDNTPQSLNYGNTQQEVLLSSYNGINGSRANRVNFNLTHQGKPIYKKIFNPSNSNIVNFNTGIITIYDHMFNLGEELLYTPKSSFIGVGQSAMGIGATANYLGIVTDRLPEKVYPIPLTPDTFKLATQKSYALQGIAVTFTDPGLGNAHQLEMSKKLTKTLISLDGIVQQPIIFVPISHKLQYNGGSISAGIATFNLSGITSIQPRDLIKIDDEYMKVVQIGFSTNVDGALLGPVGGIIQSGLAATIPTVSVVRGSVGTAATTHNDNSNVQVYRGSFNIIGSEVWFVDAPKGTTKSRKDATNLPYVKSEYSGRTFLRTNYDKNILFDDISNKFTGIGKTYTMTVEGINTTGIATGNGVLFINGVFQTPSTLNNAGNNYDFLNDNVLGISSIVFTGITSTDGTYIQSDFDINQNQLPRGGLIVSLGSTPGLGYAPLLGAKVRANLNESGSIVNITGTSYTGPSKSISTAFYDNQTGLVEITTVSNHNFVGGDRIKLVGLGFTCPSGSGIVSYFPSSGLDYSYDIAGIVSERTFIANVGTSTLPHTYIGFGSVFPWYDLNEGSGYRGTVSIGVTDPNHAGVAASIRAIVGAGGTLGFEIVSGGSGYVNPYIQIPEPIYENLEVIGISRAGIGSTTDTGSNLLLNVTIGPSPSSVGIGSTLFIVNSFQISRPGYEFQIGDVFKPIGLVTSKGLSEPISEFKLEVVETFQDVFSAWSFGEMNYIDSIKNLQNGSRTRFPLFYNGSLLSFGIDSSNELSTSIDLDAVLIIFVNGVIQQPGYSYKFFGGTSFEFLKPPDENDKVDIFFYIGENNVDTKLISINETIKVGDEVFISNHPSYDSIPSQDKERIIAEISGSDIIETDNYRGPGIDESIFRPIEWIKQKRDRYIKGDAVYKTRDRIEPLVYPSAKIIGDINNNSSSIFVDNALFFNFEEDNYGININSFDSLIIPGSDPVSSAFTATVSIAGTISNITITNSGYGYTGFNIPIVISPPPLIGIGIGTTATAIANVSNGIVTSVTITNPGFGYTVSPQLIAEVPETKVEMINSISNVQGFSGIITGIVTTTGTNGHPLALKINFIANASNANDLQQGYPIFVYDTRVGSGITSVNDSDSSIVGIGTSFLDNVYIVNSKTNSGPNAEIICNIHTNSNTVGIATTIGGKISWGRLYNFSPRKNPISIGVTGLIVDSGLSSFPTIQRRKYGLRDTGAIIKRSTLP